MNEILQERARQVALHGADDKWTPAEWAALIAHYAARSVVGDLRAVDSAAFRTDMVKVGALALAAIEAIDKGAQS